MLALRHRLAIAGVITAATVAVPAAVLRPDPVHRPGRPAPPQAPATRVGKPAGARFQLVTLAASAGISVSRAAMHQGDGDVCSR
ncbi:MAG: hypothetical protein JWM19_2802 [Actinomycetia bacterium]|nr:hypothetical protein [Actinomycetes bacterium]